MIKFNADEIFEMAEQIERNGAKFYRKAAESAEDRNRELLLRLAEMEDDHEKTFAEMRAELAGAEKLSGVYDPNDEAVLYLQAMAEGKVFDADPSEDLSGAESMEDILTRAIGLEKDSIVFYVGMKELVPATLGKGRLDGIIKQEMGHVRELTDQLEALGK